MKLSGCASIIAFAATLTLSLTAAEGQRKIVQWPRGSTHACGTLRSPGVSNGWRNDQTDHCFPGSASDHMVCCVDIKNVDNEHNTDDPTVARHNPLSEPIRSNSDKSSYTWCTCSESICTDQLDGTVAWVGQPGDKIEWKIEPPAWYYEDVQEA
eukprot:TRINITY_DN6781_c0_g1_i1.p1 TRINITY_DN6781_c0_g1~~TRINITY_DN6781_c0_g1_i1.p1  ORF type:complete len:154 (+),score=24.68 TRINITY_DN6781_c0_g1_i1:132-593(+)